MAKEPTCHGTDFKKSVVGSSCPTWQSGNSHFKCGMGSCPTHGTMNIYACHPRCESKTYLTMHFCKQFGGFRKFCNRVATENDVFLERDIPGIIRRVHAKAGFQCGVKWTVTARTPGKWAIQFILERHQSWYMKWGSLYIPAGRIEWLKRLNIFQVVLYFWNSPKPFDIASWLCSSGRWLWMLWTNIQKPIGLSEDIPQRLPSNNGKNEALIQQHLIFWHQTQILNDSNAWSSGVCIKHCVSRTCKTVSRCVTSPCFAKKNSRLEARHLLEF